MSRRMVRFDFFELRNFYHIRIFVHLTLKRDKKIRNERSRFRCLEILRNFQKGYNPRILNSSGKNNPLYSHGIKLQSKVSPFARNYSIDRTCSVLIKQRRSGIKFWERWQNLN